MLEKTSRWQIYGFLFTVVLGTLLHFLYEWAGECVYAALFSAVNESIWEHMKLLYVPMLCFGFLEYRFVPLERNCYWMGKFIGMLSGLVLIPVVYYTYTGALGLFADWFNVTIFFLAAGLAYGLEFWWYRQTVKCRVPWWVSAGGLVLLGLLFVTFTFSPPDIPLFVPPRK